MVLGFLSGVALSLVNFALLRTHLATVRPGPRAALAFFVRFLARYAVLGALAWALVVTCSVNLVALALGFTGGFMALALAQAFLRSP